MATRTKKKKTVEYRQSILLSMLIALIMFASFWYLCGQVYFAEIKDQYTKREILLAEANNLNEILENEEIITLNWSEFKEKAPVLNQALPPFSELPKVLGSLENMLQKYGKSITLIEAGDINHEVEYISLALTMQAEATEDIIGAILSDLGHCPHLLIIEQLNWSNPNGCTDYAGETILNISFNLFFDNKEE